jgi:hypothetical protein
MQATDSDVERRIRYLEKLSLAHVARILGGETELMLTHETHYHADGSQSETYYLELEPKQFERLHSYPFDTGEKNA